MKVFHKVMSYIFPFFAMFYWIRINITSNKLDQELVKLLDEGVMFTDMGTHTAKFGKYTLWIANHPYASFSIRSVSAEFLPKRYTVYRLRKRLEKSVEELCLK